MDKTFEVGDLVEKVTGYRYPGIVVSVFQTTAGKTRYVVEAMHESFSGMLHIFHGEQLKLLGE